MRSDEARRTLTFILGWPGSRCDIGSVPGIRCFASITIVCSRLFVKLDVDFQFRIIYTTWWFTFYSLLIESNAVSLIKSNCRNCDFLCMCLQPFQNKRWVCAVIQHARNHSFWNFDALSFCVIHVYVLTISRGFVFALFWIKFSTSPLHQRSH